MVTSNALSLLGLSLRGGNLAVGEEPVADACKTGRAKLVLIAADAAENSAGRASRWAEAQNVPWARIPWDKAAMGFALGRSTCAMAALTDSGLAGALAVKLLQTDESLRSALEPLLNEKKKPRAQKKPAMPET